MSWINVKDKMPPTRDAKRDWYLVTDGENYDVAIVIHGQFTGHRELDVTHWQEIEPVATPRGGE